MNGHDANLQANARFLCVKVGLYTRGGVGLGEGRGGRRDGESRTEGGREGDTDGGRQGGREGWAVHGPERRLCKVELYRRASPSAVHISRVFRQRDSGDTLPIAWIIVTILQSEGGRLGNVEVGNR